MIFKTFLIQINVNFQLFVVNRFKVRSSTKRITTKKMPLEIDRQ